MNAPLPSTTLQIQGEVQKMDEKIAGYFKDWFKEADFSDEEFENSTEVYMISRANLDGLKRSVNIGIGMTAVGAVGLIALLIVTIKGKKKASQEFY